jgi:hypothetical protein
MHTRTLGFVILIFVYLPASADVPAAYRAIAAEYSHPPELLFSVALTESGHQYKHLFLPWPWTVNHAGKGIFFNTREEAYAYCVELLDKGDTNFDVSVMQINWYWHGKRFASLWDAFDPYTNIRVGAQILWEEYQASGSYDQAIGFYHSRNVGRAARYRERVQHMLSRVSAGRVR